MRLHALPSTSKRFVMNKRNGFHALPSTSKRFVMNKRNGFEVLGLASCHNKNRYVTVISRDIRMYCGRFVGPSHTIHGWSPCFIESFCIKNREIQVDERLQTHIVLLSSIPRVSRGLHTHTHTPKGASIKWWHTDSSR